MSCKRSRGRPDHNRLARDWKVFWIALRNALAYRSEFILAGNRLPVAIAPVAIVTTMAMPLICRFLIGRLAGCWI